ncbi:hypothetical protein ILYODFUR_002088 [Ilyodon furcidens]|uniref:Uncharacterized protein n=1 Tax=Ilyodon furcidens TaxID=33524 RepID=A0ABV0U3R7_9TELE
MATPDPNFDQRYPLEKVMELLGFIDGDNSEVEDLSDIDDPVGDPEYQLPQQEPSSSEEDNSGCEDPILQPSKPIRWPKCLRKDYEGYRSDRGSARLHFPRHCSWT